MTSKLQTKLARVDLSLLVVATDNYLSGGSAELLLNHFATLKQFYQAAILLKALRKITGIYPNSKQAREEVQNLIFDKYPQLQPQLNFSTPLF